MLCHPGIIAFRTNSTLKCDPKTGHIIGNQEASASGAANTERAGSRRSDPTGVSIRANWPASALSLVGCVGDHGTGDTGSPIALCDALFGQGI